MLTVVAVSQLAPVTLHLIILSQEPGICIDNPGVVWVLNYTKYTNLHSVALNSLSETWK